MACPDDGTSVVQETSCVSPQPTIDDSAGVTKDVARLLSMTATLQFRTATAEHCTRVGAGLEPKKVRVRLTCDYP